MARHNCLTGPGRLLAAALISACAASAQVDGVVTLNTSSLIGSASGPFTLDFQFNEGNGAGDSNNTVTLYNFAFGGGAVTTPASATTGGVTVSNGPLSITLVESSFYQDVQFAFTPGTTLSFHFHATANKDVVAPDGFTFSILDKTLSEIPTNNPNGFNTFLEVDLPSPSSGLKVIASSSQAGGVMPAVAPGSVCDVNADLSTDVADVQLMIDEALGTAFAANDLDQNGRIGIVDIQFVIDAALNLGCAADNLPKGSTAIVPRPSLAPWGMPRPSATRGASPAAVSMPATITDLGTLGGFATTAYAINNLGQVVGSSEAGSGCADRHCPVRHAFLWQAGRMTDLGLESVAYSINDAGVVAGSRSQPGRAVGSFLYTGRTAAALSVTNGKARAINSQGQVVGDVAAGSKFSHAFLWTTGTVHDLGTLGGDSSRATGINDLGEIVGSADLSGNSASHAFRSGAAGLIDLGTLGGTNSAALAINNAGQIVGFAQTAAGGARHAFLYSQGVMQDLGTLGGPESQAGAINSRGAIVGWSRTATGERHACLWTAGRLIDLNNLGAPGATMEEATGINDAGQVVANGANGRAFLIALPIQFQ